MLRYLGQKVERVKHLEVARGTAQQFAVAEDRERLALGLFGAIHDLAIIADRYHAVQAERASVFALRATP